MPPGLPIGHHHGSPTGNTSTRWPGATLDDLVLFRSLILDQTDAAIIRGMERTMDVVGGLAYRAGYAPGAPLLAHGRICEEEKRAGNSLLGSVEAGLDRRAPSPPGWTSEDANVGDCALAAYAGVERVYDLSTIPRIPNTRPSSFSGRLGSLGNQDIRQRSNTDPRRKKTSNQATPPALPEPGPESNPLVSGSEFSLPINEISMFIDAETIGRLMVAAGQRTLGSSRQYTMIPDHQRGHIAREAAPYRKNLDRWLGADVGSLPDTMSQPACARGVVTQGGGTQPQRRLPSVTHAEMKPAGVRMTQNASSPFERFMALEGISTAEEKHVEGNDTTSRPPMPQDSDFETEHAATHVMLQRRRQNMDRPMNRKLNVVYPNEEELKAIQRDIRSRIVQGWAREERAGTWYGYSLGI